MIRRTILLALLAWQIQTAAQAQQNDSPDSAEMHREAVELARAGQYEEALEIFTRLRGVSPNDQALLYDHIVTLSWAGMDAQVIALADELDDSQAPVYVISAIARSHRNLIELDQAIAWYRAAIKAEPANVDARIGLALTLADANEFADAHAVLDALDGSVQRRVDVSHARAYIYAHTESLLNALRAYDSILEIDPSDAAALRGKALILRDLLLPQQALDLEAAHPGILTNEEAERLRVDALAVQLRLAANTFYPRETDGVMLDQTIAAIDARIPSVGDSASERALRFDKIVALAERNRAEEAVVAFEALGLPIDELPSYLLAAAAGAYLQLHNPERALELSTRATRAAPGNLELRFTRLYAYLDLDDYESAMRVAKSIIAEEPMLLSAGDTPIEKGNANRLRAEVTAAIADSSIEQLAAAQERLESLLEDAPNNPDLRHELANVYRSRGWLDRSLFEYDQVLAVDEDLLHAKVGHAYTQLDAQAFPEVESTVHELNELDPTEPVVERLTRDWATHNRSELLVDISSGDSTGSTFGTSHYDLDATWFTRPVKFRYRGFVHLHESSADFPEGSAHRSRAGVGAEYRAQGWTATGELSGDRRDTGRLGIRGTVDWRISDQWLVSSVVALDTDETQIRAYRQGIEADQLSLRARYAPHESTSFSLGWQALDSTDGNLSTMFYGEGRRRVLVRPKSIVEVMAEVSSASNDLQDVPYFSPSSANSYLLGALHEWRIRRRYERSLSQTTTVHIGRYDQSGYPSSAVWRASYRLSFSLSRNLFIQAGVQRSRMNYDGTPEYDTTFVAAVQARL